jgi:hypothetical protein
MRSLLLFALCAAAQEEKTAEAKISPVKESPLAVTVDTGYRFLPAPGGNFNTYRSVVNLGEGPKVLGVEAAVKDWKNPLFDRLEVSARSWGGEPYSTLRTSLSRKNVYWLDGDYRNAAYFNFLPSFANPGFERSSLVNQRSFDLRRRMANVELELMPGARVVPYFAFSRDGGRGSGITPFVANGNEYPVSTDLSDSTSHFRGGVHIDLRKSRITLEQGGSKFGDDQRVFATGPNRGNRESTIFGQTLLLGDLDQRYTIRGDNVFTKGLFSASPTSWVQFHSQFIYSRPKTDVRHAASGRGLFFLGGTRFFNGFGSLTESEAKMPRSSASASAELCPLGRLRIFESWTTDRHHNASSALLAEQAFFSGGANQGENLLTAARFVVNYNRQQADGFYDVTPKLTLRGGHRYLWGNARVPPSALSPTGLPAAGTIRQHTGLAGFTTRLGGRVTANADYEGSPGDRSYFRTSLHNYHQLRSRTRVQIASTMTAGVNFALLENRNPNQLANFELASRSAAAFLNWLPAGGSRMSLMAEYARSVLSTDVWFSIPQTLDRAQSSYRDRTQAATAVLDARPWKSEGAAFFSLGGSLVRVSGSRPANYYQPLVRGSVPMGRAAQAYAEWRWYGLSQAFFLTEGFRAHQFTAGLRLTH